MTKQQLDEIEARLPKADWKSYPGWGNAYNIQGPNTMVIGRMLKHEDAEFVVQAANDIRALLEAVRKSTSASTPKIVWTPCALEQNCWMYSTSEYYFGVYQLDSGRYSWFIDDKKLSRCLYQGSANSPDEAKKLVEEAYRAEIDQQQ